MVRYLSVQNQLVGWGHVLGCSIHIFLCVVHMPFPCVSVMRNFKKCLKPDTFEIPTLANPFLEVFVSYFRQMKQFCTLSREVSLVVHL